MFDLDDHQRELDSLAEQIEYAQLEFEYSPSRLRLAASPSSDSGDNVSASAPTLHKEPARVVREAEDDAPRPSDALRPSVLANRGNKHGDPPWHKELVVPLARVRPRERGAEK
jgi:hypothetical protein